MTWPRAEMNMNLQDKPKTRSSKSWKTKTEWTYQLHWESIVLIIENKCDWNVLKFWTNAIFHVTTGPRSILPVWFNIYSSQSVSFQMPQFSLRDH